jgi:hypothetical protein
MDNDLVPSVAGQAVASWQSKVGAPLCNPARLLGTRRDASLEFKHRHSLTRH